MSIFDTIPQLEVIVSLVRFIRYDDLITLSTIIPAITEILRNEEHMKALIRYHFISHHEEICLKRFRLDQLHRLYLRYQSIYSKEYSIGSELFIPTHKVIYYAHVNNLLRMKRHLNNIVYDPVPVCRALAYSGDLGSRGQPPRCMQLASSVKCLQLECITASLIGAIQAGHVKLSRLLINELISITKSDHSEMRQACLPIIKKCLKWCRIEILDMLIGITSDDDVWGYYINLYNTHDISEIIKMKDVREMEHTHLSIYNKVLSNKSISLEDIRSVKNHCIPGGIIRSKQMIDRLLISCPNHEVWKSLIMGLDGTQPDHTDSDHPLNLLLHVRPPSMKAQDHFGRSFDEFGGKRCGLPRGMRMPPRRHLDEATRSQILKYVESLSVSNLIKLDILVYASVTDLEALQPIIDSIDKEVLSDRGHPYINRCDIYSADAIIYIAQRLHGQSITHVDIADPSSEVVALTSGGVPGVAYYLAHIEEEDPPELSRENIGSCAVSLRYHNRISKLDVLSSTDKHDGYVMLSVGIKMGTIPPITYDELIAESTLSELSD